MKLNKSFAEFLGTYIFLFVIIATGNAWAIGLTLALVIYILGNISGGNFNPAVTVMMVYAKKQPYSDLVPYVVVQIVGGLAAFQTYKYLKTLKLIK